MADRVGKAGIRNNIPVLLGGTIAMAALFFVIALHVDGGHYSHAEKAVFLAVNHLPEFFCTRFCTCFSTWAYCLCR